MQADEKLAVLKMYFDTRRGRGHTHAMVEGAANVENVSVLVHSMRYGKDIERLCGKKITIITWESLEGLCGSNNALVIDNSAMSQILGDALEELRKLRSENSILKAK